MDPSPREPTPRAGGPAGPRGHAEAPPERFGNERVPERAGAERLQGVVDRVTYHDPESRFAVLQVQPEQIGAGAALPSGPGAGFFPTRVSAVGVADAPAAGMRVRLRGRWEEHASHGRQFRFSLLEVLPPLDRDGLVRYLASSAFPGVGPTLAERIVDHLGTNALARIREDPDCLAGVTGLRKKVRTELARRVQEELGSQEAHAFLLGIGLGPWQADAVAKKHGADVEARVRANPYVLARGISGVGFHTADRVARHLGVAEDSVERLGAALAFALQKASSDGHTLLPRPELFEATRAIVGEAADERLEAALADLASRRELVVEDEPGDQPERRVYLPALHTCETTLAANLDVLLGSGPVPPIARTASIRAAERRTGLDLHARQREAVEGLLGEPVALLTGGPGVGKTTIVRLVVELAEAAERKVVLASPTGRAAKRLAEATGREAATVHRLLGWEPARGRFQHDAHQPLEADLVVVDEISMLDLTLAHHLLKAVQPPTRLVLVGDPDQLPSVAAGNVLSDLLASGRVPTWRLTEVYRQERESLIVENAHRILAGELPRFPSPDDPSADFYLFPTDDDESAAERLVEVVTDRIPRRFGLDWVEDVQVLAPMYRGACGVDSLNARLREALGLGGLELRRGDQVWRIGDRVIHTRNDYEKQVFNGDMGRIVRIAPDGKQLIVRYPEREVPYEKGELSDLQPAFAITVHRSQGGEFPAVVMPLVPQHALMLQRNLLYTAVTRARRLVVLVGSRRALAQAVENARQARRESRLAERLRALGE